jgi:hypothetical protein
MKRDEADIMSCDAISQVDLAIKSSPAPCGFPKAAFSIAFSGSRPLGFLGLFPKGFPNPVLAELKRPHVTRELPFKGYRETFPEGMTLHPEDVPQEVGRNAPRIEGRFP